MRISRVELRTYIIHRERDKIKPESPEETETSVRVSKGLSIPNCPSTPVLDDQSVELSAQPAFYAAVPAGVICSLERSRSEVL